MASTPPTGIPRLYAPDLWYRYIDLGRRPSSEVQEVFVRGHLVRTWRRLIPVERTEQRMRRGDLVKVSDDWYTTTPWKEEGRGSLLDTVLFILREEGRPHSDIGELRRGRVRLAQGEVEGLIHTGPGFRREYAMDPWDPLFDGLPWFARSQPLVNVLIDSGGKEAEERLWDWGPTPLQPQPPAPVSSLPEVLGLKQVMGLVSDTASRSSCLDSAPRRSEGLNSYRLDLVMRVRPDGGIDSASLSPREDGGGLTGTHLRCLEAELLKLRLPRHTRQMEPLRAHFTATH